MDALGAPVSVAPVTAYQLGFGNTTLSQPAAVALDTNVAALGSPGAFLAALDNGLGNGDLPNDLQGWTPGSADRSGYLRSERSLSGSGRVYTLAYQARDKAGNTTTRTTTMTALR